MIILAAVMNGRFFISAVKWVAGATLCVAATARAERERIERVFPAEPGVVVRVESYRGAVEILESDVPEVRVAVDVDVDAPTEAEARRARANLQLIMDAAENVVTISGRNPPEQRVRFVWEEDTEIALLYQITVPRRSDIAVKVLDGSVMVGT